MQFSPFQYWTIGGALPSALCGTAALNEDERWMLQALVAGERGAGISNPNPSVGCVIVKDGRSIATGATEIYRQRHAERVACDLLEAAALRGATAYVTLEPCSHVGHQPACADLLIEKGIARVVLATCDPNPKVAGEGVARLRRAGVEVETGVLEKAAQLWHLPFFLHLKRQRPIFCGKWAQTPSGLLADDQGNSKWITGPEARAHVHGLRQKYDAILVSAGTVLVDLPRLTVRDRTPARNPVRLILDLNGRLGTITAELAKTTFSAEAPTILFLRPEAPIPMGLPSAVKVVRLSIKNDSERWPALQAWAGSAETETWLGRPLQSVLVEGGAQLLNDGLQQGVFDILHVYTGSPKFSGSKHRILFSPANFDLVSENPLGADTLREYIRR